MYTAVLVITLKVDPGGKLCSVASGCRPSKFSESGAAAAAWSASSVGTLGLEMPFGSYVGLETMASTAPVVGLSTTTAPSRFVRGAVVSAFMAAACNTGSTVSVTSSGSDGGVLKRSWLKFCGACSCVCRYWSYSYSMPDVP